MCCASAGRARGERARESPRTGVNRARPHYNRVGRDARLGDSGSGRGVRDGVEHGAHVVGAHRHAVPRAADEAELDPGGRVENRKDLLVTVVVDDNVGESRHAGFVEGDDIGKGTVDVVVTEGFAGNIALKTAEGTARQLADYLKAAMSRTWRSKIGYLFARDAFKALKDKMDPNKSNGGVFLGLNGIVVKSHGGTNAEGFAYAVDVGYDMVRYDLLTKINQTLDREAGALVKTPSPQEAVS